jgi:hypothetical protein
LIVVAIWTAILLAVSNGLQQTRRAYKFGVGTAVAAYFVATIAAILLAAAIPSTPSWIIPVILAPVVEEMARLVGADSAYRRSTWRQWAIFGIGYALFESGLKLSDGVFIVLRSGWDQWLLLIVPVVPFLLHVFLSMLMCLLLQRGVSLFWACVISMGLHAAHNWTALNEHSSSSLDALWWIVLRSSLFLALISMIIRFSKRPLATPSGAT